MTRITRYLSFFMIPALLLYTFISLSIPLSVQAQELITPFTPESADSLPIEGEVRPQQQAQEPQKGSYWWKWALGIAVIGGAAAAAGGGGGDSGSSGSADTGEVTATW